MRWAGSLHRNHGSRDSLNVDFFALYRKGSSTETLLLQVICLYENKHRYKLICYTVLSRRDLRLYVTSNRLENSWLKNLYFRMLFVFVFLLSENCQYNYVNNKGEVVCLHLSFTVLTTNKAIQNFAAHKCIQRLA